MLLTKVYFFQKDYSKASDTLSPVVDYFIGINDLTYASESLVQLSQSYRFNNNAKKAKEILVGYQIKTNAHKYLSSIELYLSNLSLNNELDVNKLNELLKNDESSKEIETYIYFNIAIISNQETYVEKSKQMLSELFEATNDYKYKFNLSFFK